MKGGQFVAIEQLLRPWMVGVLGAGAAPTGPDLLPRRLQHRLVGGVLPLHEVLDDAEKPLALEVGEDGVEGWFGTRFGHVQISAFGLAGEVAGFVPQLQPFLQHALSLPLELGVGAQRVNILRRVVHHLGEDHCPRRRQRSPRPPQVQRAGMPVADGLLPCAGGVDRL